MPRFAHAIRAFNGGELSPRMQGRGDLPAYAAGARRLENFIPLVQGPALRRSGTRFVAEVKDSDDAAYLIPFTVATEASYMIEVGPEYFRFYTQEGRLESGGSPVEVTTPYAEADLEDIRWAQSADTLYLVHPSYAPRTLVRTSATSFSLSTISFTDGPYLDINTTSTNMNPSSTTGNISITASSTTGINGGAGFQSSDVGRHISLSYGAGRGYAVITGITSTTIVTATVVQTLQGASGTVFWRLGVFYEGNYPRMVTFHEQRLWFGGTPDYVQRIDGSMTGDFTRFSPTGQRLDSPKFSELDVFDDNAISFTLSSNELNAILWSRAVRTLQLGTSQSIFNMRGGADNTAITPSSINVTEDERTGVASVQPIAMSNVLLFIGASARRLYGISYSLESDGIRAVDLTEFADHILCSGARRLAVAEQPHSLVLSVCNSGDLAVLVFRRSQRTAAWAKFLIGGSWPDRSSAVVESVGVTSESDQDQVWLLVKRKINGSTVRYVEFLEESFRILDMDQEIEDAFFVDSGITFDGAATGDPTTISGATAANPVVLTITSHPYSNGEEIRVTGVVGMTELNQRTFTVTNATTHTLELSGEDGSAYAAYQSGGKARKKATTLTGLTHLEGESVEVLGDGAYVGSFTVSSGQITLTESVSRAQIGLPYTSVYESLPLETSDPEQSSQGKNKVFNAATVRVDNTVGFEIGPTTSNLLTVPFRSASDPMDIPLAPFTGDKRVTFHGGWDREGAFVLQKDDVLPATFLLVNLYGEGGAR